MAGIILLVLGGLLVVLGWPGFLGTMRARRWPGVPGIVADAGYTYTVDGVSYTGRRATFGSVPPPRRARRAPGAQVAVFYDPRDPARSVLQPVDYASMLLFDVGVALIVVGVLSF